MGIHNLNKFLTNKCSDEAIYKVHLSSLKNKIIVIDTSIYMYKFLGQNKLIENFYLLVSILLHYKITPVFVFDGKPPPEKMNILKQRKQMKKEAKHEYYVLQESIDAATTEEDRKKIMNKMENLKKEFIRISDSDIQNVKTLFEFYGIGYIEAEGEADVVCSSMVINGEAWACLSDDMDMFLYGCNRVLRFISLLNHCVVMYDTAKILRELNMDLPTFQYFTVPCGTDYNSDSKISLPQMMKHLNMYKNEDSSFGFDKYLVQKGVINESIYEVCDMFCLDKSEIFNTSMYTFTKNAIKLREFLSNYGFIFT
jgi:5'-3' exonuclease